MGPGWRKAIRAKVGGTEGRTHLTELLFPTATVAMKSIWLIRSKRKLEPDAEEKLAQDKRLLVLDTCHACASNSPVVRGNAPGHSNGAQTSNQKS